MSVPYPFQSILQQRSKKVPDHRIDALRLILGGFTRVGEVGGGKGQQAATFCRFPPGDYPSLIYLSTQYYRLSQKTCVYIYMSACVCMKSARARNQTKC